MTTMSLIISVSGVRGIVGETFTVDIVRRFASVFEATLSGGPLIVGHDGRSSGPDFADVVAETLAGAGRHVLDVGPCATPTMGVLISANEAAGGIQISASHNPIEYNGIKLFGGDGRVLPAVAGGKVRDRFLVEEDAPAPRRARGRIERLTDTTSEHWQRIAPLVNVARIRARRFPVLLDSNHGAGSKVGHRILGELGCHLKALGAKPDGRFEHSPEPTRENLVAVGDEVARSNAVVGFCQDPDADRLALIDEQGRYVGEEYTLALCVNHVLQSSPGPVVTNCSTSRMADDLASKYGVPIYHSAVGEAHVVDLMLKHNAAIGGEGNGGVIHPQVVMVRDSMVAMALVLDAMADRQLPLSFLVDELPRYAMHKTKVVLGEELVAPALIRLERHFATAHPNRLDGLRLDWADRWLLVRASNTEPIVRIFSEAPTSKEAESLCTEAAKVVEAQL